MVVNCFFDDRNLNIVNLQERAVAESNGEMASRLDEAIELWNSMWMADFIHDQTIADNVRAMQSHSSALLKSLKEGIDQLTHLDVAHKKKLGSVPQER